MMIDRQLLLSNAQPVTASTVSTNTIDLASARDIGIGDSPELLVKVVTPFSGGTSLQFSFITSANADLSSPTVIVQTPAIPAAQLTAGSEWLRVRVPAISQQAAMQRYIGLAYTAVGAFTGGTVTAGLVADRDAFTAYPSGANVTGF